MFSFLISSLLLWAFFSSISTGLLTQKLGKNGALFSSLSFMVLNLILITFLLINLIFFESYNYSINFGNWIVSDLIQIKWSFFFDRFNLTMLFVVNSVSTCVHFYSIDYMEKDPHLCRFLSYISLFTFFMIMLVTGDNFLILFFGWEGVGLCSYLLVNFWFTRVNANKSAMKALIVNRIGDFGLTLGLICIFYIVKSLDFAVVFALAPTCFLQNLILFGFEIYWGTLIGFLLLIGAVGKSAQLGLHIWLPDAMEGPTPVSALIHAATMVTAGVFLIIKCSPLFEYMPTVLLMMVLVGALTSFFAASVALVQNDIKKVIAYSTCSQLGYMIFACGLSAYHISFFHLTNHAFFKALLFLTAGAIIHSLSNEQDMRKYGALSFLLPLSAITTTIGSLALAGTPFLSGFYSKDAILEIGYAQYTIEAKYAYVLGLVTAALTSTYSYRVFFLTFISSAQLYRNSLTKIHESPFYITLTLVMLSIGSIFSGFFFKEFFIGFGNNFWQNSIFIHSTHNCQIDSEFIPQIYKILPFIFSLALIFLTNIFYQNNVHFFKNIFFYNLHSLLINKWYFDAVYNFYIAKKFLINAYEIIFKSIDKGVLEIFGPTGLFLLGSQSSFALKKRFNSQISDFSLFYVVSLFLFLLITYLYI